MSHSAPGKTVKKARVEGEGQATPRDLFDAATQPGAPGEGLGGTPDVMVEVEHLREENARLQLEVEELRSKLNELHLGPDAAAGAAAEAVLQAVVVSDEAARKRLARLCAPNSQGTLGSNRLSFNESIYIIHIHNV